MALLPLTKCYFGRWMIVVPEYSIWKLEQKCQNIAFDPTIMPKNSFNMLKTACWLGVALNMS